MPHGRAVRGQGVKTCDPMNGTAVRISAKLGARAVTSALRRAKATGNKKNLIPSSTGAFEFYSAETPFDPKNNPNDHEAELRLAAVTGSVAGSWAPVAQRDTQRNTVSAAAAGNAVFIQRVSTGLRALGVPEEAISADDIGRDAVRNTFAPQARIELEPGSEEYGPEEAAISFVRALYNLHSMTGGQLCRLYGYSDTPHADLRATLLRVFERVADSECAKELTHWRIQKAGRTKSAGISRAWLENCSDTPEVFWGLEKFAAHAVSGINLALRGPRGFRGEVFAAPLLVAFSNGAARSDGGAITVMASSEPCGVSFYDALLYFGLESEEYAISRSVQRFSTAYGEILRRREVERRHREEIAPRSRCLHGDGDTDSEEFAEWLKTQVESTHVVFAREPSEDTKRQKCSKAVDRIFESYRAHWPERKEASFTRAFRRRVAADLMKASPEVFGDGRGEGRARGKALARDIERSPLREEEVDEMREEATSIFAEAQRSEWARPTARI